MKTKLQPPALLRYLLCMLLLSMGCLCIQARAEEPQDGQSNQSQDGGDLSSSEEPAEETPSEDEKKDEEASADEGADFPFSFDDVAQNLVIIECSSELGDSAGSGFIARMDGKTYIFTNQHVIMGADRIEFATVAGEHIAPKGVELALTRDIARLPIDDRDDALTISENVLMNMPLAVFGNSEGGGVATELYGEVTGVGADLVEVSAEFVSGNSGSPVINKNKEVIGIASYVRFSRPSRMTENTKFENKTRRFCYRLTNEKWAPVRWRQYNEKYGKPYQETVALVDSVFDVVGGFFEAPFNTVSESYIDSELERWSGQHNRAVSSSGNQRRVEVGKSTKALAKYCERHARNLGMKLQQRDLTEFLRDEFEGYKGAFEYAAEVINYFNTKLPAM